MDQNADVANAFAERLKPMVVAKAREYVQLAATPKGRDVLAEAVGLLRGMQGATQGSDAAAMLRRLRSVADAFNTAVERQLGAVDTVPSPQQRRNFNASQLWKDAVAQMINNFIGGAR